MPPRTRRRKRVCGSFLKIRTCFRSSHWQMPQRQLLGRLEARMPSSRKTGLRFGPTPTRAWIFQALGTRPSWTDQGPQVMQFEARSAGRVYGSSLLRATVLLLICASDSFALPPAPRCATQVVSYAAGTGAGVSYQNPNSALGAPTLMTGAGVDPGAVTPFRPAFMPAEIVSVGRGGHLVLAFDGPVFDDARNAFGVDLIVYGNSFFSDLAYPGGLVGFHFEEGGSIDVSADGVAWHTVSGAADGGLPTMAYVDAGPYQVGAGSEPADPARPVNPAVTALSLLGTDYPGVVDAYNGGCGGTRIDLAEVGLSMARFVRVRAAVDAPQVPEVDALVAVRHEFAAADLNGDGWVDGADLGMLLGAWGSVSPADLNGDGTVDGADLGALLGAWSS